MTGGFRAGEYLLAGVGRAYVFRGIFGEWACSLLDDRVHRSEVRALTVALWLRLEPVLDPAEESGMRDTAG